MSELYQPNASTSIHYGPWKAALEKDGFCLARGIVTQRRLDEAARKIDGLLSQQRPEVLRSQGIAYGVRNLLELWPQVVDLVRSSALAEPVLRLLGRRAAIVRGLVFDKPPQKSWTLPWHRDRTIAIESLPGDLLEFSSPTVKSGVVHVTAPSSLLKQMLTLRISIDPMAGDNGPLVVLPGSHCPTVDRDEDLITPGGDAVQVVQCDAGDVFCMRPLLAHSSQNSHRLTQRRRRIIHLELCGLADLPGSFSWRHFIPVAAD